MATPAAALVGTVTLTVGAGESAGIGNPTTLGSGVPPRGWRGCVTARAVGPAGSLYEVVKASCPWAAAGPPAWIVPLTVPGGNPVTAVPGLSPRSPLTVVAPVLVTVEPARTANVLAAPRATGACPAGEAAGVKLQLKSVASALPARSLAPVVTVAVNAVRGARLPAGVKVAVTPA